MIQKKILFAVIGLSAFSLLAATRKAQDVPVDTVEKLVEAITNGVSGDRILLAPRTYDLTGTRMSTSGDSARAHLHVKTRLTIAGTGSQAGDTVLKGAGNVDCGAGYPLKVMYISVAGTVISNLTITGGYDTSGIFGGGVCYASSGGSLIVDCIVSNNYCSASGGGVGGKYSTDATVNLVSAERCHFIGNWAASCAGAMTCRGAYTKDCVFSNNWCETATGGAVMSGSHFGSRFYYNRCCATKHGGGYGGGAVGRDYRGKAYPFHGPCVDCLFVGNCNTNSNTSGAAIYGGCTALTNCTFEANHCVGGDGVVVGVPEFYRCKFINHDDVTAFVRYTDGTAVLDGCVFATNNLENSRFFYSTVNVRNSLFVHNTLKFYATAGTFENCTFTGNTFPNSRYFLSSDCGAVNCVFAGNSPYEIPESASYIPYMTNCLWTSQVKTNDTMTTRLAAKCSGTSRLVADVKFKDPANGDYSPKGIRSPLYNAGYEDDAYLATVGATDCAGGERVRFDHIDIGAFELQEKQGLTILLR